MVKSICVALKVNLQITLGCESVAADVALVGPLAGVAADVDLEGRVGAEDLSAVPAAVLEEGLAALAALPLGAVLVGGEVGEVVGEESLTSVVEDALGALLQQLERVDGRALLLLSVVVVDDDGRGQRRGRVRVQDLRAAERGKETCASI